MVSSLHTTTAHFLTFAVTLHVLVYARAFSICFCNPLGVCDIPTKSPANINPDTVSGEGVTRKTLEGAVEADILSRCPHCM